MMAKRGRPRGTALYPVIDGKKECSKCHRRRAVRHFNTTTNAYGVTYYRGACRDCVALQKSGWFERRWKGRYRKRELKRMAAWYAANRPAIRAHRKRKQMEKVLTCRSTLKP